MNRPFPFFLTFVCLAVLFIAVKPQIGFSQTINVKAQGDDVYVLELFTSQSCSSCPPADRVLSELYDHENVVALSCNVTYWNHLHWEDTLSREFCTARQREYSRISGRKRVFTPQLLVNGEHSMIGSRRGDVNKILSSGKTVPRINAVYEGGVLVLSFPPRSAVHDGKDTPYSLTAFTYAEPHEQAMKSGENSGRVVTYASPVLDFKRLQSWSAQTDSASFDLSAMGNTEAVKGISVLAQDPMTGVVVAAGRVDIK